MEFCLKALSSGALRAKFKKIPWDWTYASISSLLRNGALCVQVPGCPHTSAGSIYSTDSITSKLQVNKAKFHKLFYLHKDN